jgi:2-polyprenyl-3-methyl-5-hydroxy-6-metoxy-1,4-benzoquinol methylase
MSGIRGGGHPGGGPGAWPPAGPIEGDVFARQYAAGTAPWDIGGPQPEMVKLEESGAFGHRVLDVGCGRGALSIYLAARGHQVLGIDGAAPAIECARAAAEGRGLDVVFVLGDVIETIRHVHDPYDAAVDVGFFHALDDDARSSFVGELARVLAPGGLYAMLAFSERVPGAFGPRRVSADEIRSAFSAPQWRVRDIRPAELRSAMPQMPVVDANLVLVELA